jgi:hypothetical protein
MTLTKLIRPFLSSSMTAWPRRSGLAADAADHS